MKKKLTNFSLVMFSFGFAFFLAEVIVRLFWPQNLVYHDDKIWREDDKFGWRRHELLEQKVNFGQGEVTIKTDEHGFRINLEEEQSADSTYNVLVIGDSFLEAVQVESRKTVPKLLQKSLNNLPAVHTRFYNAGVSGWDPNHYYMEAERVLNSETLNMDHVLVFLYTANDLVSRAVESYPAKKQNKREFRVPESFDRREWIDGFFYPINDFLEKNSHIYILLKSRNRNVLTRMGLSAYSFSIVFQKRFSDHYSWQVTTDICKRIEQLYATKNIPVNFVLIPTTYQTNTALLEEYLDMFSIQKDSIDLEQPNRIFAELFAKDTLNFSDPLSFFRAKTQTGEPLYGDIDTHFNEAGHEAMAEFLMPLFVEEISNKKSSKGLNSN